MTKIITFSIQKGGNGKSALCYNLGCALMSAKENTNKKLLFVDMDTQSNLSNYFGIEAYEMVNNDVSDVLLRNKKVDDVVIHSPFKEIPNIDLIPSSFNLLYGDIALNNIRGGELRFNKILNENKEFFNSYDYIFIDVSPYFNIFTINALSVADVIVSVIKNSCISSLKSFEMQTGIWNTTKDDLNVEKIQKNVAIINMYDSGKTKNSQEFNKYVYNSDSSPIKEIVATAKIRNSVVFNNANVNRKPVVLYDKKHKASQDIIDLVKELEEKNIF